MGVVQPPQRSRLSVQGAGEWLRPIARKRRQSHEEMTLKPVIGHCEERRTPYRRNMDALLANDSSEAKWCPLRGRGVRCDNFNVVNSVRPQEGRKRVHGPLERFDI